MMEISAAVPVRERVLRDGRGLRWKSGGAGASSAPHPILLMMTVLMTLVGMGETVRAAPVSDAAVLQVRGRGISGRPAYTGGGEVAFLSISLPVQLIHFTGGARFPLPFALKYQVRRPAPILLTSRFGTEYWRLFQFRRMVETPVYTDEIIDLRQAGTATARGKFATVAKDRGAPLQAGLCGLMGHYYFLIDKPGGDWLDVTTPPPILESAGWTRKVLFTLANLSRYSLDIDTVQSTWEPGGIIRAKITVTDASGARFPVVNMPAVLRAAGRNIPLTTQFDWLGVPTGWMVGRLPRSGVPERITVHAVVRVLGPRGMETRTLERVFPAGTGKAGETEIAGDRAPVVLPRMRGGRVRETRALWVTSSSILTREGIRELVDRAARARINMLLPSVFVRSQLLVKTRLFPMSPKVEKGLDPLAYLIRLAHARGIEVHPWFCVTYRDSAFRKHFPGVDIIDRSGKVVSVGADVHRPEYRKFIVGLMVGTARDYAVDGIHLDYIRTMARCWCPKCRAEFERAFHKPLEQATDDEWMAWQRSAIGDIVRRTAEGVRKVRPHAILSAAVFSNRKGGAAQGQDPAGWCRRKWLDIVIPMDYKMQTLGVYATEKGFLDALDDDSQLVTGLSLYQRNGRKVSTRPVALVREQIRLVRRMGIHGYCLFVDRYLDDGIVALLHDEINREPAVPYFRGGGPVRRHGTADSAGN